MTLGPTMAVPRSSQRQALRIFLLAEAAVKDPYETLGDERSASADDRAYRYLTVKYVIVFLLIIIGPVVVSAANYLLGDRRGNWQTADRSSAGRGTQLDHRKRARGFPLYAL